MAVSIDSVYQQVLAVANKEQRGYVTPQEFNLFARKAQNDVFENTFAAYKDAFLHPQSVVGQHNDLNMLREKMQPFRVIADTISIDVSGTKKGITATDANSLGAIGTLGDAVSNIYWIESVYDLGNGIVFEEATKRQVNYMMDYRANKGFPASIEHIVFDGTSGDLEFKVKNVYYRHDVNKLFFYPINANSGGSALDGSTFVPVADYVRKLSSFDKPEWAFVVNNNKALYNGTASQDFVLHESEESSLVNKILELAGIAIDKVPLADMAIRNEQINKAQQAGPQGPPAR